MECKEAGNGKEGEVKNIMFVLNHKAWLEREQTAEVDVVIEITIKSYLLKQFEHLRGQNMPSSNKPFRHKDYFKLKTVNKRQKELSPSPFLPSSRA